MAVRYILVSIKDELAGFTAPSAEINEFTAIRAFEHAIQNPRSLTYSHPKDYSLYKIGELNVDTGELIPESTPKKLADASSFIRQKAGENNEVSNNVY